MKRLCLSLLLLLMAGCGNSIIDLPAASTSPTQIKDSQTSIQAIRAQGQSVIFRVTGDWGSGFGAELVITNLTNEPWSGWTLDFDAPFTIDTLWNAQWSRQGSGYRLTAESWNGTLPVGGSVTVGFNGHPGGPPATPTNFKLNGQEVGQSPTPAPSPSPSVSPSPTPEPPPTGEVQVSSAITGNWGSGFGANIVIENKGDSIDDWTLRFDLKKGDGSAAAVDSIWNVEILSTQGATVTVGPMSWNRSIAAGGQVEFGFIGSPGGASISNPVFISSAGSDPAEPPPAEPPPTEPDPEPSPAPVPPVSGSGPGLVAYFAEWGIYDRNYHVSDIPAESVNVINYAFAKIENGEVALFDSYAAVDKAYPGDTWEQPLRGNFHQLAKLKAQHPHLKVMISVGGWTLSGPFSDAALTPASRDKFSRSAVAFIKHYGFDGVDIDWEYPVSGGPGGGRPADKENYTLLLQELRRHLDAHGALDGKTYLLSIAAPAGSDKMVNLELDEIGQIVDWINVMTYDYHGAWESVTNHHAPLWYNPQSPAPRSLGYTVDASIQAYLQAGVPPHKVVLGVPAYGRSWSQASGLFQAAGGPGVGTWEAGILDYKDLLTRIAQQPSVYQRVWDEVAQAPVLLAPSLNGLVVSYEDEESLAAKIAYARENHLGGFLLWELSGDAADTQGPKSLVGVMARALRSWPTSP